MLDRVILISIRNKFIVLVCVFALILWGIYSLQHLPIDAVPDITNNQVQIITRSPSLGAQEVERLITFPIEMAMATIPGREEMRSFSRSGLSVVTLVFHDEIDIYWARQQVAERINDVASQIPTSAGKPELAPVTTGLGEIYQYILKPKQGFEHTYSLTELRSIQDWIVRRRLLGTEGVADVSSFGGHLKQYEVALNPERLRAMNVSMNDVLTALERNNYNTGGAYIDKYPQAYFIRSEGLVRSISDIENITVLTQPSGTPILLRDVATVRVGSALRYGAMTHIAPTKPSGEVVGGLVLMLKGENSSKVIANVKARIKDISASLPEGIEIVPFLDRTKLVNTAITTVATNLAEGGLIVVFVLILFLGNLRAGLIVASAIPLSLLFAIVCMNLFGVSGNLMSLGAIDFGIIIDGAVIIVEATLHHLHTHNCSGTLTQAQMDNEVYRSASAIRTSAAFGEIIILIVYLPVLTLLGIEGKMFRPMAQTVGFAILGAFILSLTYIPAMSALVLKKTPTTQHSFADRMMATIQQYYIPILTWALRRRFIVLAVSAMLLSIAIAIFLSLGGEFVPTLDEGDFAVETRTMLGSSLSHTIETTLQAGRVLVEQFPEVVQVVGKIGTSEIPTDPMPIEAADLMVILKPQDQWTSAHSREELAERMHSALRSIPQAEFGFQQPIQMRFNELLTGAKQDVVVKVFGEDLAILADRARRIGTIAATISGVTDVYVERVTGSAQIVARLHRSAMARFGISVDDINKAIRTAFAGEIVGTVFEHERRYNLVVRFDTLHRKTLSDVENLLITTPHGTPIPLRQVASVQVELGVNQIQREDAKRRIIVGFNVRNRDVESVVEELRTALQHSLELPPGYYITYGGTFEHLTSARQRLHVAVPTALALIFILLYLSFRSVVHSAIIFTAVPLAAIGGVLALWLRGMPFSISAGVGFIALFGVSVLNGIVLLAYFQRLRSEGIDLLDIVRQGTAARLRPVLMTAAVASLGFLPMALSHSAGAEVQKPLATVVIGGLVSSTILTLIVLPVMYVLTEELHQRYQKRSQARRMRQNVSILAVVLSTAGLLDIYQHTAYAQQRPPQNNEPHVLTLEQAITQALQHNPALSLAEAELSLQQTLRRTATALDKASLSLLLGQYNSAAYDNNVTITQSFPFPTVFVQQLLLADARIRSAELQRAVTQNDVIYAVKSSFYRVAVLQERERLLRQQDTLLIAFATTTRQRYRVGEVSYLATTTADLQSSEHAALLAQARADIAIAILQLQTLLAITRPVQIVVPPSLKYTPIISQDSVVLQRNPMYAQLLQQISIAEAQQAVETARILPDISIGYFSQTLIGVQDGDKVLTANDRLSGIQLTLSLPLWIAPHLAQIEAAARTIDIARTNAHMYRINLLGTFQQALQQYSKHKASIDYYEHFALPQAQLLQTQAQQSFEQGDIGYVEYAATLSRILTIKTRYCELLEQYNQAALTLEFLAGMSQEN
ncbi:MAG: CusA/CzcA family heavy metal efflux RND transporter [Bacteroidota bacterium]|nr:CusA/CzcA family heavy metal efflux RND transporter [Candidatus Kapabacteria bacterium]MDW8220231.1 CusA/CzcA family heavy metal efflux RND transporter [Bacteroidota bacterium]